MTNTPDHGQQPRIPGVRYRRETKERWVDVEFNGEVKRRKETYYEWVAVPPINLDRVYLRAVISIAVLLTLAAAVWSTTAIGRLLSGMVPGHEGAGYIGALAFEVPWVACLMVQWILRDQPDRARPVNVAGWLGLVVVVTAVVIDGYDLDMPKVGAVAACVSVLAKGMWWVVLRLFHVPLDEDNAGWLNASRQEMAVSRVMHSERARMGAMDAWMTQVYGAQSVTTPVAHRVQPPALPAASGHAGQVSGPHPDITGIAVPAPAPAVPALSPAVPVPDTSGQPPRTVSAQVSPPPIPPVPPVSGPVPDSSGHVEGEGPSKETSVPPVPPVTAITRQPIAAICRKEIAADADVKDAALVTAVLAAGHPKKPNLADTVRRTAQRVDPTRQARKIS